ncbi:D-inositol-3-phosphate glycosyltransferase [Sphingomonas paucimobilis]|nr:D-inositol-3-phosphate glycosyltransferase [Sphingomonas paucimobilis]
MPTSMTRSSILNTHAVAKGTFLIDISRLIWRLWSGRLPTGIDRVCLAYIDHFGGDADLLLQWKGRYAVFTGKDAQHLLNLLKNHHPNFQRQMVKALVHMLPRACVTPPKAGYIYLNIGHTGLDSLKLVNWICQNQVNAIHFIHDIIPIEAPEFCRPGEYERHVQRITNALQSASGIIGNSQATIDSLHSFALANSLPTPPMVAAWLASDALPKNDIHPANDQPYFVMVGTIEGRKNHLLLLQIWKRLVQRLGALAPQLILVGQRGWEAQAAFAMLDRCPVIAGKVIEHNHCRDDELSSLLRGARALLMPSHAEGFGMPVVEALKAGTPVIASNLAVFREIAGDIPTYIDPLDATSWENHILNFCHSSPERLRQIHAMENYAAPTWVNHFNKVDTWLQDLIATSRTFLTHNN